MDAAYPSQFAPLYRQVERYIEQLISERQLPVGAPIPSLAELSRQLQVNSLTVAKAIRELVHRQVLVTRQGKGTFVGQGGKPRILMVCGINFAHPGFSSYFALLLQRAATQLGRQGFAAEMLWWPELTLPGATESPPPPAVRPAGYVFSACTPDHPLFLQVRRSGLPYVDLGYSGSLTARQVRPDFFTADLMAMEHLKARKVRQVILLGMRGACAWHGDISQQCSVKLKLIETPGNAAGIAQVEAAGYQQTADLLRHGPIQAGLYVSDDILARGATRALLAHGRGRLPELVVRASWQAVMPLAVPLTYVLYDLEEQAQQAARILLDQIQHRQSGPDRFLCPFRLVAARTALKEAPALGASG